MFLKPLPFRCHSRFCPTCGNKFAMERTTSMSFKLGSVQHRHHAFTIAENPLVFFLQACSLLNCLFHSVSSVISRMFFNLKCQKLYSRLYHGPSYFWSQSQMKSPHSLPVKDFIKRLIRHIPEKHFKIIRYGGGCMQGTVRLLQNCTVSSQKRSTGSTAASLNGELLFFSPSVMILCIKPLSYNPIKVRCLP